MITTTDTAPAELSALLSAEKLTVDRVKEFIGLSSSEFDGLISSTIESYEWLAISTPRKEVNLKCMRRIVRSEVGAAADREQRELAAS